MEEFDKLSDNEQEIISDPDLEKSSSKYLFFAVLSIVVVFGFIMWFTGDNIKFIDITDLTGKTTIRASDESYTYNDYEFTLVDDIWYTDIQSGNTIYTVGFHFDPDKVRDIEIKGKLSNKFLDSDVYYIAFDPTKEDLKYTALGSAELQLSMGRAMQLPLKAACLKEHPDCVDVPIVTCESTDKPIFVIEETTGEPSIIFDDNCVTVSGNGLELIKAVDRLLYFWYGVMV